MTNPGLAQMSQLTVGTPPFPIEIYSHFGSDGRG